MYVIYLRELYEIRDYRVSELSRQLVLAIRDGIASTRGHGAAHGFIRAASALFSWAVDRGYAVTNPAFRGAKELDRGHLTAWTKEQAEFAIARLSEPLRRVVVLALYTGARRGDLCALTWAAYDGNYLRFVPQKTRRQRTQPLTIPCLPALKAELDQWRKSAVTGIGNAPILTDYQGKAWKPNYLSHQLPEALARIGLTNELNMHGLRKLWAANLAQAGCPANWIAATTGHSSLSMVELYTRSADQQQMAEAAIVKLADHLGQGSKA